MALKLWQIVLVISMGSFAFYAFIWYPQAHHPTISAWNYVENEAQIPFDADGSNISAAVNRDPAKYNICDDDIKPRINIIVHHKTGTHLFREFMDSLKKYHRYKCNVTYALKFGPKSWINLCPNGAGPFKSISKNFHKYKTYIIIHSIRNPVDTILSAYNYHKTLTPEPVHKKHKFDNIEQLNAYRKKRESGIYSEQQYCFNHVFFDESSPLRLNESLQKTYTVQKVLQNVYNLSQGLEYEYHRFFCYDAKDIIETYISLKHVNVTSIVDGRDAEIVIKQVSMEQFHDDFNKTALEVLDAMRIATEHDIRMLMDQFVKYNIADKSTMDSHHTLIAKHITQGHYDRDKQIKLLLRDQERCDTLKSMTELLDMQWKFSEYC